MTRTRQPWFRFYVEAIHDPKLTGLTPGQRWLWVCLLAAARQSPVPGALLISDLTPHQVRSISDLSSLDLRTVKGGINAMLRLGMLTTGENGEWLVTAWKDRQYESDSSVTRTSQWRHKERHKDVTKAVTVTDQIQKQIQTKELSSTGNSRPRALTDEDEHRIETEARRRMNQLPQAPNHPTAWLAVAKANIRREHDAGIKWQPKDPPNAQRRDYDHPNPQCKTCGSTGWIKIFNSDVVTPCQACK